MEISVVLSLLTGIVTLAGYIVYNRDIFLGACRPNAVSWALWTMAIILNMASYFSMTGDLLQNSLQIVSSGACAITFGYALYKKNYSPLTATDKFTLGTGIIAVACWWWFDSAVFANMIIQFAIVAAFIPTYKSVWNNPANEKPTPWFIFSLAYLLLCLTVFLRWQGSWADLVFPLLGVGLHLALAILIIFRPKFIPEAKFQGIDKKPNCAIM